MERNNGNSKMERGGDTGRTSSRGQKLSSGTRQKQRGNAEMDDQNNSPVSGRSKLQRIGERRKPAR